MTTTYTHPSASGTMRPATSPQAYQRAQALLAGAERRQQLMGHALQQAEAAQTQAPLAPITGSSSDVVQQISQTAQANMLAAHHKLQQAEYLLNDMLAKDAVMAACHAQAYNLAPVQNSAQNSGQDSAHIPAQDPAAPNEHQAGDGNSDVVDVEFRVITPPKDPPQAPT